MNLKRRSFLAMVVMGVVAVAGGFAGTRAVSAGFERVERATLQEHIDTVEAQLAREDALLRGQLLDYAHWTDTLEFVTGAYPEYPAEAIGDPVDTLSGISIDGLIIRDAAGEFIYDRYVASGEAVPTPPDVAAWVAQAPVPALDEVITAVTEVDGRPAIVAMSAITDNDGETPADAIMVMIRSLDDELLADLSAASPANLSLAGPGAVSDLRFSPGLAEAGLPLLGPDGQVTAALRVTMDRPVAAVADRSLVLLGLAMTAGLTLGLAGFAIWLTARVTRRIARLDHQMDEVTSGRAASVEVEGGDEIASLSGRVQALLDTVAALEARRADDRLEALIEQSDDIVLVTDDAGSVRFATPALERMLGTRPAQAVGLHVVDVLGVANPEVLYADLQRLARASRHERLTTEHQLCDTEGGVRWLEIVGQNRLETKDVNGLVLTVRDRTERKRFEEELRTQAVTDPLTGLANRTLFHDRVQHALSRRIRGAHGWLAVLFLDLDDFKTVNDGLGHAAGDDLLRTVAERLATSLRPSDTAARLGGDEFACLLEDLGDRDDVVTIVNRIQVALSDAVTIGDQAVRVQASIGVALCDGEEIDAEALLRNADMAMYAAKNAGKDRFQVFAKEMHVDAVRRLELKGGLAEALERGEFRLVYQPIVDLHTGRNTGAEALLRWHHPVRGVISPVDFIPLAEETGLIVPLGRWVLEEACREATRWQHGDEPARVSVNLSVRQLADDRIVDDVARALATSGLEPALLQLELTESLFIADPTTVAATLGELKALGVLIAVDDFGTGYSSLSYLRDFPIDVLKVDRSFIRTLDAARLDDDFTAGVLTLARHLKLATVAEGVETEHQRAALSGLACDYGQGYLFARPVEVEEIRGLFRPKTHVGARPSQEADPDADVVSALAVADGPAAHTAL